eukprot:TRINITY_DN2858_c0_g1_i1.p1 TRINITY_DN2858_c0_g1~~TRINITY_DN2858_c0_g1_i1.p1  ORF type:complete len:363 (+),score=72.26 TRINITY_DN2858_c0_g1_i1:255-1343(+)
MTAPPAAGDDQPVIGPPPIDYVVEKSVGSGSFGQVFLIRDTHTNEQLALKRVLQDRRFKNRELSIMQRLHHTNIVRLRGSFFSEGEKEDEVYLNLILEFIPDNIYRFLRHYYRQREYMPLLYVRLFVYQLARSLAYLHAPTVGVCHRDIKPQNLLMDSRTGRLCLCDFGSAKVLVPREPNVAYICSRYYRAPELIMGSGHYDYSVDLWSLGCVFAELMIGAPVFPGESSIDQLIEIIKILGTPTKDEIRSLNPQYLEFTFPSFAQHPWSRLLRSSTPPAALDLLSKILTYTPSRRLRPLDICAHPFFDDLRNPNARMPDGTALPELFDFSPEETAQMTPELRAKLYPPHVRPAREDPARPPV